MAYKGEYKGWQIEAGDWTHYKNTFGYQLELRAYKQNYPILQLRTHCDELELLMGLDRLTLLHLHEEHALKDMQLAIDHYLDEVATSSYDIVSRIESLQNALHHK